MLPAWSSTSLLSRSVALLGALTLAGTLAYHAANEDNSDYLAKHVYGKPEIPFSRLGSFFWQFGIGPRLPPLSVTYDGGRVELNDGVTSVYGWKFESIDNPKSLFLKEPPTVKWNARNISGYGAMKYDVLFVDLGPANNMAHTASPFFPFIHTFWADCVGGSLETCPQGPKPFYRPPGNMAEEPNRYTFLLFEKGPDAPSLMLNGLRGPDLEAKLNPNGLLQVPDGAPIFEHLSGFDFKKFAKESENTWPIAWNYMMVGHAAHYWYE